MPTLAVIPGLSAQAYQRSELHANDRVWVEKNCYVDVWIEVIHTLGLNPIALMPFTLAIDFEGDQWTFFKPPHDELRDLYGIDVQELNMWRPLLEHASEHLAGGKLISAEADAFWLPDTAGTDYRRAHTKSTIVLADLDRESGRLGYFHNAGYFELEGEDFRQLFRVGFDVDPTFMPLFAELVRIDGVIHLPEAQLAAKSLVLLARHLARVPKSNPVKRFMERLSLEFPGIIAQGLPYYHAWAFATIRQLGAAAELAAIYLAWLARHTQFSCDEARSSLEKISTTCKSLILKAARSVNAKRALDVEAAFAGMDGEWEKAMQSLTVRCAKAA